MKRKICIVALVLPLIFTISYSFTKQNLVAAIESSVSETEPIKSVALTSAVYQDTITHKSTSVQANTNTLTPSEQQMVTLVNQARVQNHVPPLKVDMLLAKVARIKAQDMITNRYFSHTSPKYGSPFNMMKAFGIKYTAAGENIAGNPNVVSAENSLMKSPGHRKNILNPAYTHIGIGIKNGGPYGKMISQMFISKPK